MRSILLKSRFDACLECKVTVLVLSKLNSKKHVCKSIDIQKNNLFTTWIRTRNLLYASPSCSTDWAVFDGMLLEFSPLLYLQAAVERRLITTFTLSDKLEGGRWWVGAMMSTVPGELLINSVTDRQTDRISALYMWPGLTKPVLSITSSVMLVSKWNFAHFWTNHLQFWWSLQNHSSSCVTGDKPD